MKAALATRALQTPFGRLAHRVLPAALRRRIAGAVVPPPNEALARIAEWEAAGRIPWTVGYAEAKHQLLKRVLRDGEALRPFAGQGELPEWWGVRFDERVVEYPWLFARQERWGRSVLDAGSTLNEPLFLDLTLRDGRTLTVVDLDHKYMDRRPGLSYVWGDLRDLVLRDACVDTVVSLSTLEHVGLDNTRLYTTDARYQESSKDGWRPALSELRRVLKPGGRAFVTLPFGVPEDLGWMQVFDRARVAQLVEAWDGPSELTCFRYDAAGWRRAEPAECIDRRYHDVHTGSGAGPDGAAAARAVACLELRRD